MRSVLYAICEIKYRYNIHDPVIMAMFLGVSERGELKGAVAAGSLGSRGSLCGGVNLAQLGSGTLTNSTMGSSGGGTTRVRHPQTEWQRLAKLVAPEAPTGLTRLSRRPSQRHRHGHVPNVVVWFHVMDKR